MIDITSIDTVQRGDIIREKETGIRLIVRTIENGIISTKEKRSSRKGPDISSKDYHKYEKINIGNEDTDSYREKIIQTYLKNRGKTQKNASKKYRDSHKIVRLNLTEEEEREFSERVKKSGKKKEMFVMELVRSKSE